MINITTLRNAPKNTNGAPLNGPNMFALPPSDTVNARVLSAGSAETIAVPDGANVVVFSATEDFYAKYGASPTAAAPSGDVTDGSASELNPVVRDITGVANISVVSPATCIITAAFYKYDAV